MEFKELNMKCGFICAFITLISISRFRLNNSFCCFIFFNFLLYHTLINPIAIANPTRINRLSLIIPLYLFGLGALYRAVTSFGLRTRLKNSISSTLAFRKRLFFELAVFPIITESVARKRVRKFLG